MTGGSLFSGIGGLDLGFQRAGIDILWQFETDNHCKQVLSQRFPQVPNYGSVKNEISVPKVDLLFGGFPCTPVSHSGAIRSTQDHRWLWPWFVKWIQELKPEWIIIENVPGLRSAIGAFGTILDDLARCGYDAEWDSVSASTFGAPHKRERVFIVAYPNGKWGSHSPSILSEPQSQQESFYTYCSDGSRRISRVGGRELESFESELAEGYGWWGSEPKVGRLVYGIPDRLDRIRTAGNAVVPQVAEWIGRRILAV